MLPHMGQHGGGVKVYTKHLLRELLALDSPHEFVLMYQDPRFLGTYGNGGRVREIAVRAPSVVLWDQMVVPYLAGVRSSISSLIPSTRCRWLRPVRVFSCATDWTGTSFRSGRSGWIA